eukprot:5284482-Alexandrium_andersonii.AAC.1
MLPLAFAGELAGAALCPPASSSNAFLELCRTTPPVLARLLFLLLACPWCIEAPNSVDTPKSNWWQECLGIEWALSFSVVQFPATCCATERAFP